MSKREANLGLLPLLNAGVREERAVLVGQDGKNRVTGLMRTCLLCGARRIQWSNEQMDYIGGRRRCDCAVGVRAQR